MAGFCDALNHVQRSPSAPPVKINLSDTTTPSFQNPEAGIDGPKESVIRVTARRCPTIGTSHKMTSPITQKCKTLIGKSHTIGAANSSSI